MFCFILKYFLHDVLNGNHDRNSSAQFHNQIPQVLMEKMQLPFYITNISSVSGIEVVIRHFWIINLFGLIVSLKYQTRSPIINNRGMSHFNMFSMALRKSLRWHVFDQFHARVVIIYALFKLLQSWQFTIFSSLLSGDEEVRFQFQASSGPILFRAYWGVSVKAFHHVLKGPWYAFSGSKHLK